MSTAATITKDVALALASDDTARTALRIRPLHVDGDGWTLAGLPAVLPLWADATWTFGLMAMPGVSVDRWPGVMVWQRQAITVATTAATLLPRFVVERFLSNQPEEANALKARWPQVAPFLEGLHAALGGDPAAFAAIADTVNDDDARARFRRSTTREAFEAAHDELFRAIDPSPEFAAFADWFSTRLRGGRAPPTPDAFGAWARQSLAWSLQLDIVGQNLGDHGLLLPLVTGHAGWDTGISAAPGWSMPGSGGSSGFVSMAAMLIDTGPLVADPIDRKLLRALTDSGMGYDGLVHAAQVPVLDEQGAPERAWAALCAAAWWMHERRGDAPTTIVDAARLLASRHGWTDVLHIFEQRS